MNQKETNTGVRQTTQTLPPEDATILMSTVPAAPAKKNVRELPPTDKQKAPDTLTAAQKQKNSRRKKYIVLAGVFLAALFLGFVLSGYYHDKQQLAENERLQQKQVLTQRESNISQQEKSLREQRTRLEQQKRELEQQQADLQSQAARAQGRNEQITADGKSGSAITKVWDKITGKEKERQQTIQDNTTQSNQAAGDAASLDDSIDKVQTMMNDMDDRLQSLDDMREQAGQMKQTAADAYAEHAGIINQVLYYASQGVETVKGLLAQ